VAILTNFVPFCTVANPGPQSYPLHHSIRFQTAAMFVSSYFLKQVIRFYLALEAMISISLRTWRTWCVFKTSHQILPDIRSHDDIHKSPYMAYLMCLPWSFSFTFDVHVSDLIKVSIEQNVERLKFCLFLNEKTHTNLNWTTNTAFLRYYCILWRISKHIGLWFWLAMVLFSFHGNHNRHLVR
jgi:hypothetical protein